MSRHDGYFDDYFSISSIGEGFGAFTLGDPRGCLSLANYLAHMAGHGAGEIALTLLSLYYVDKKTRRSGLSKFLLPKI